MRPLRCLAVSALVLLGSSFPTWGASIDTCGSFVAEGDVGVLTADLVCTTPIAVTVRKNGTLQLAGHTIRAAAGGYGVLCEFERSCTLRGPGQITGALLAVFGPSSRVRLDGVDLIGNAGMVDVAPGGRLTLRDVTADGHGFGMRAKTVIADGAAVEMNGTGNCIMARTVRGAGLTVSGCHDGVSATGSVHLSGLVSVGNSVGLTARHGVVLADSTVTGSYFPPLPGLDIASGSRPRLKNTSCGGSARLLNTPTGLVLGVPWGVCSND